VPAIGFGGSFQSLPWDRICGVTAVDQLQKLAELLQVDAHLVNQLAECHLLRGRQPVEITAIGLGIQDGLHDRDAQQLCRFFVRDFGLQCPDDPGAMFSCCPQRRMFAELSQYPLQPRGVQSRGPPEFGRGRLEERMRIEWIALQVLPCRQVKTHPGSDQRPLGLRVGIRRQHPSLMAAIAERVHQLAHVELHLRVFEVAQQLNGRRNAPSFEGGG
jgi:hypothetical protein